MNYHRALRWVTLAILAVFPGLSPAAEVTVAVASNFTLPSRAIAAAFHEAGGHRAILSFGSTGKLFAQISQGAPFQVFLAADSERPARLEAGGHAIPGSRMTYALGRIALYSSDASRIDHSPEALSGHDVTRIAIANPTTAPYGRAAVEVLEALRLYEALQKKLVRGENIGQTFQFVATGNAQLGFVAMSQLKGKLRGSWWQVPQRLYTPIRQQAVLLRTGEDAPAAQAFLEFLAGDEAREIIAAHGYGSE